MTQRFGHVDHPRLRLDSFTEDRSNDQAFAPIELSGESTFRERAWRGMARIRDHPGKRRPVKPGLRSTPMTFRSIRNRLYPGSGGLGDALESSLPSSGLDYVPGSNAVGLRIPERIL